MAFFIIAIVFLLTPASLAKIFPSVYCRFYLLNNFIIAHYLLIYQQLYRIDRNTDYGIFSPLLNKTANSFPSDRLSKAFTNIGIIIKTEYILRYITDQKLRRK